MKVRMTAAAATAALLVSVGPSHAATFYETINGPVGAGKYALDVVFSAPVEGSYSVEGEYRYNVFDRFGDYVYGNEEWVFQGYGDFGPATKLTVGFISGGSGVRNIGELVEHYSYNQWVLLAYEGERAVSYAYSFRAVPEPGTWAMMIIGFGIAGGSIRRRRTYPNTPACLINGRTPPPPRLGNPPVAFQVSTSDPSPAPFGPK